MKLIGKALILLVALSSWMWIAPKVWPTHRLLFTILATIIAATIAFLIWPAETFPKT